MKVSAIESKVPGQRPGAGRSKPAVLGLRSPALAARPASGFTMVEIAICLAIIGIALIAIIGVLPMGISVQRDNRQETIINQDAAVFLENIRNGAQGLNDLTNYVFAISNFWTSYANPYTINRSGVNGYTYTNFFYTTPYATGSKLTNGANIIGLMSTPEYTDNNGAPIPNLIYGGISNHVVAYVHSLSGPADEKPPQNNDIVRSDSFSYKILCDNLPMAVDTNLFYQYPPWQAQGYNGLPDAPVNVSYVLNGQLTFWQTTNSTAANDYPGESPLWVGIRPYRLELTANLRELRLTFLWPLLPNGFTGPGRHTFATTVAGQLVTAVANPEVTPYELLYFFRPQSFTSAP